MEHRAILLEGFRVQNTFIARERGAEQEGNTINRVFIIRLHVSKHPRKATLGSKDMISQLSVCHPWRLWFWAMMRYNITAVRECDEEAAQTKRSWGQGTASKDTQWCTSFHRPYLLKFLECSKIAHCTGTSHSTHEHIAQPLCETERLPEDNSKE